MRKQGALRGLEALSLGFTALGAVGCIFLKSAEITLGVISGGLLMTGNMWVLRRVVEGLLGDGDDDRSPELKKRRARLIIQYVLKMAVLFGAIFGLIKWGGVSPGGIIIGLTVSLAALIATGLKASFDEDAPSRNGAQ